MTECGIKGSSEEDKHNHIACGAKNIHTEALYWLYTLYNWPFFPPFSFPSSPFCLSRSLTILTVLSFTFLSPSPLLPLLTYFPIFHLPFSFSSPSFLVFLFFQLKVTHKQLALLLGAFAAYFSGNHTAVEGFMKEFHSKIQELQSNRDPPEWLEELPSPQDQQSN